jgi:hypothetical protein
LKMWVSTSKPGINRAVRYKWGSRVSSGNVGYEPAGPSMDRQGTFRASWLAIGGVALGLGRESGIRELAAPGIKPSGASAAGRAAWIGGTKNFFLKKFKKKLELDLG